MANNTSRLRHEQLLQRKLCFWRFPNTQALKLPTLKPGLFGGPVISRCVDQSAVSILGSCRMLRSPPPQQLPLEAKMKALPLHLQKWSKSANYCSLRARQLPQTPPLKVGVLLAAPFNGPLVVTPARQGVRCRESLAHALSLAARKQDCCTNAETSAKDAQ